MPFQDPFVRLLRSVLLQGCWERLHHASLVGMNYFGGAHFTHSGERGVIELVRRHAGAETCLVFDVGANQGAYAQLALEVLGANCRIHCFEPAAGSLRVLRDRLAEELASGQVVVVPKGAGRRTGQVDLHVPEPGSTVASIYPFDKSTRRWKEGGTETIDLIDLDSYCAAMGIDHIHFLKVDVEGHELAVLQGAEGLLARGAIDHLQFEFGEAHIDARTFFLDFHRLLHSHYDLYRVLPGGLRWLGPYTPDMEVFRTANFLAVKRGP